MTLVDALDNQIAKIFYAQTIGTIGAQRGIMTIDAMGTQKQIAQQSYQAGAEHRLSHKGNQGK
jgi:predicted transposase YbfD/YdcC